MAVKNHLLFGFIGFILLQAAEVEPKGCSCRKEKDVSEVVTPSMESSNDNIDLDNEIMSDIEFNSRSDVINYLNRTFKNVNSEVTLEGRGPYAYVGDIMVGTIEVIRFNSDRAVIKWGTYPFVVDLDCNCMVNDAGGVYKPLD